MARFFKNPNSEQVEEVDGFQVLAMIFFPLLYLIFAELWWHVLVWIAGLFLGYLAGPTFMGVVLVALYIGYCFAIRTIVANAYLRKGWIEVDSMKPVTPAVATTAPAEQDAAQ